MHSGSAPERGATRRGIYRPELDGLRFFAFLAVFLHHALPDSVSGMIAEGAPSALAPWLTTLVLASSLGVDFFLCLSAFLITELLVREQLEHTRIDYRAFLVRRALRIWPLYYAFLAFVFFVWPMIAVDRHLTLRQLVTFATFTSNWECAFFGYPTPILAPLWSIALEEQFYLLWPLVMHVASTRGRVRLLLGMMGVALVARLVVVRLDLAAGSQMLWCNSFPRLDPIALGALLAILARGRAPHLAGPARVAVKIAALATIGLTAHLVPLHRDPIGLASVPSFTVMALACTAILWSTLRPEGESAGLLGRPALVWLGQRSYGLYVFHMLGLVAARALLERLHLGRGSLETACLALLLTLALAAVSFAVLERPFLRMKARFTRVADLSPSSPEEPLPAEAPTILVATDTNAR